jgi:hypothetical protein
MPIDIISINAIESTNNDRSQHHPIDITSISAIDRVMLRSSQSNRTLFILDPNKHDRD